MIGSLIGLLAWGVFFQSPATAQSYPERPVTMVVPFAAGGSTDVAARVIGRKFGEIFGQTFIVENKPGGGTTIGTRAVARAKADGYTLLYGSNSLALNPTLRKDMPYDTLKDLRPIGLVARQPFVLVVHPSVPANSVQELIAYAKANPGAINFGSAGTGTGNHLAQELFAIQTGTQLQHVSYQGDGPMVIDLMAGRLQMSITTVPSVMSRIESGALRALGVGDAEPLAQLPNVPPISKAGVPGYVATAWNAMFAPAGTPDAIVAKLSEALEKSLQDPAVAKALDNGGAIPSYMPPKAMTAYLIEEIERWGAVIKARNISID